jgi:hypothetical protein
MSKHQRQSPEDIRFLANFRIAYPEVDGYRTLLCLPPFNMLDTLNYAGREMFQHPELSLDLFEWVREDGRVDCSEIKTFPEKTIYNALTDVISQIKQQKPKWIDCPLTKTGRMTFGWRVAELVRIEIEIITRDDALLHFRLDGKDWMGMPGIPG